MNTILVKLTGGLGNQMFQYAAARHLALLNEAELLLDVSEFTTYKLREFCLQHFSLQARICEKWETRHFKRPDKLRTRLERMLYFWRKPSPLSSPSPSASPIQWVRETGFAFDPALLEKKGSFYLDGYWQSPNYFLAIEQLIRSDFHITTPPDAANQAMAAQVSSANSVSLHVRRGDYHNNANTRNIHGVCSLSYYSDAARIISSKETEVLFFVFSDEIEWARANLNFPGNKVFVDLNDSAHNYEDLRLMSLCKHHIIANSTFSWWGAWMGRPDGLTLAPSRWMNDPSRGPSCQDLLPAHWIQISPDESQP